MNEEETPERERFNAYDAYKRMGWRIDELWDELDKFNARIRSNTARLSRLKVRVEQGGEEEEEPEEEEEGTRPRSLQDSDLHRLTVGQLKTLFER